MPSFPSDPPVPTLPGTIPINSRLRLVKGFSSHDDENGGQPALAVTTREQLLRAKQLLLQLKELSATEQKKADSEYSKSLALIRLTIRALETGDLARVHLDDVTLVLDEVTRQLNAHSFTRKTGYQHELKRQQLSEWFEAAIVKDQWPLEDLRELASQMYREFLYLAPPLKWYQALHDDPYLWAASHGLNTAQILQHMLHPVQFSSRHVQNAILAGLLHDVGMARIPVKVLTAQTRTDPASKQQWRHHATWLAERLRPHLKPEEFDVAQAIAQHHEKLDGSGYPSKCKQGELIELSKQLAVADTYAALCQARPHRPAYSTRQATQMILKEAQIGRLDHLAALLLLPWGMAPVGSRVELSDGSQGEVISWAHLPHGSAIMRPVIALPQQLGKFLDLDLVRDRHIVRILDAETKQAG